MRTHALLKSGLLFVITFFAAATFCATSGVLDDAAITAKIKGQIVAEKTLSVLDIGVSTTNGVVSLSGKLDSDTQASTLIQIAQSTPGVMDVDTSDLKVTNSTQPLTDTIITAKIKGMYLQQKLFGSQDIAAMTITVETKNGKVYLGGTADTSQQVANAVSIAKSVKGVKSVVSGVTVTTHQALQ